MSKNLSSYILSFFIILSNVVTVIYCYPIFLEYIIIYCKDELILNYEVGLYIGFLLFGFEFAKIVGNLFWSFISNKYGTLICINISLVALTILNFFLSYSFSYNIVLILRILSGFFNCIGILSKNYLLELFSSESHYIVIHYLTNFANLSTIIGFLIGGLIYSEPLEINQMSLGHFNKYYVNFWTVSFINFITLIINLVKTKFKLKTSSRRIQMKENNQITQNLPNISKNKEKIIKSTQKPELVLFENSNQSINKSSCKETHNNIDKIIEKEDNLDDFSKNNNNPKEIINISENDTSKNNIKETMNNRRMSEKMKNNLQNDIISKINTNYSKIDSNNLSNYFSVPKKDIDQNKEINLESNVFNKKKQNQDTNIIENNNSSKKGIHENYNDNFNKEIQIYPLKLNENETISDKEIVNIYTAKNSDEKTIKFQDLSNNFIFFLFCCENNNIFKMNFIFSIIQICEVVLYNLFVLILFTQREKRGFGMGITEIALIISGLYVIYFVTVALINWKINNLSYNNKKHSLYVIFQITMFIAAIIGLFFPLNIILINDFKTFHNDFTKPSLFTSINYHKDSGFIYSLLEVSSILISCFLFLIRNIMLTISINCYNILISKTENIVFKINVNNYNSYLSNLFKSIFGFLTCIFYYLIMTKLENKFYFFVFSIFSGGLLFLSGLVAKNVKDIFIN